MSFFVFRFFSLLSGEKKPHIICVKSRTRQRKTLAWKSRRTSFARLHSVLAHLPENVRLPVTDSSCPAVMAVTHTFVRRSRWNSRQITPIYAVPCNLVETGSGSSCSKFTGKLDFESRMTLPSRCLKTGGRIQLQA